MLSLGEHSSWFCRIVFSLFQPLMMILLIGVKSGAKNACGDDNRDGRCDTCSADACRHEGNISSWYNEYHCDWEPLDSSLHSGWGYEGHGFYCYDCDRFIGDRTHKEECEYVSEYHFNGNEGECWDCGMEMTCGHWGTPSSLRAYRST